MRITEVGNLLIATHTGGPIHAFLEFVVGYGKDVEPEFQVIKPRDGWPAEDVKLAVLAGIEPAGGTGRSRVLSVRVLGDDTPDPGLYKHLAIGLANNLQRQSIEAEASA